MALPNPGMVAVPFDIYTAEELNDTYANIEALADGSGLDDASVTADKIDFATLEDNPITHYQPNDVFEFNNTHYVDSLFVTSGRSNLYTGITLPKSAEGRTVTFNTLTAELRGQGYLSGVGIGVHDLLSLGTVGNIFIVGNRLNFYISKNSGDWDSLNNTSGSIMFMDIKITFT